MNMFTPNSPCPFCKIQNQIDYEVMRLRRIRNMLVHDISDVTPSQKEAAQKKLNSGLKGMCEKHEHCPYGLSCSKLNNQQLIALRKDIESMIVLLSEVNPDKLKSYAPYLNGYYPKAAHFLERRK